MLRSRSRLTGRGLGQSSGIGSGIGCRRGMARGMAPGLARGLIVGLAIGLSGGLAGCSTDRIIDDLPAGVGLPADAPARPKVAYQYPAVHDMPPPRATPALSDAAQVRLEKELLTDRDRLEGKPSLAKKSAARRKKPAEAPNSQPLNIKSEQGSGAATKP
jgi:hypothetical protein